MTQMSLRQQAYEGIRRQIISLELKPGSVINESRLRRELGLGRTPIREALHQLSLEKLVNIAPRRGMFVADIGITDLQQLFEIRLVLESLATRLAAERGTQEQWQRMADALEQLPEDTGDVEGLIAVDEACHQIIYEAAGNEFLLDSLVTLYALSLRLWYYFLERIGDMRGAIVEHKRILTALQDGDGREAARLMEGHILAFQAKIEAVMVNSRPTAAAETVR